MTNKTSWWGITRATLIIFLLAFAGVVLATAIGFNAGQRAFPNTYYYSPSVYTPIVAPTFTPDDSPISDGFTNYSVFRDNAEAGYMQVLSIGWTPSMDVLDDNYYLVTERDERIKEYHTFAIKMLRLDARTGVRCYDAWSFDGRKGSKGYGEAFCMAESDVEWLFSVHRAYYTGYRTY